MAKRESIWKANDGTEHRGKQSAAVADASHAIRAFVKGCSDDNPEGRSLVSADTIMLCAAELGTLLANLDKARAAIAKHEAKGEK